MKSYRAFVERRFISVLWVDVTAESPKEAAKLAKKYARKALPNTRESAVDNRWQINSDEVIDIDHIGTGAGEPYNMVEVMKNVFTHNSAIKPAIVLRKADGTLQD